MTRYELGVGDGNMIILKPVNKLTNEQYDKIKPIIENKGGHWREKFNGFVFYTDCSHMSSYTEEKEKTQFFPTPTTVANRMMTLSRINDITENRVVKILEPSAGRGALLDALPSTVRTDLYIVEADEENVDVLRDKGYNQVEHTTFEDFCEEHGNLKESIDFVFMNPPFSGSRDAKHIMLAYEFIKPGGTLVAIISENALYYKNEYSKKLREWIGNVDAYIEPIPYGSFRESGTNVDTVMVKVVKK